ncbi:hypothetical protein Hanom_Chr04g00316281 [Helianthus anomalus]
MFLSLLLLQIHRNPCDLISLTISTTFTCFFSNLSLFWKCTNRLEHFTSLTKNSTVVAPAHFYRSRSLICTKSKDLQNQLKSVICMKTSGPLLHFHAAL